VLCTAQIGRRSHSTLFRHPARSRYGRALIVASTEGGVEIETVAAKSPEKIIRDRSTR